MEKLKGWALEAANWSADQAREEFGNLRRWERTSGAGEGRGTNDVDLPTTGEGGVESEPGHNAVASIGNYAIQDPESIDKRTMA